MISREVKPANDSKEVLAISLISVGIIVIAALLIILRNIERERPQTLRSHQQNASEVLNDTEWKKYSDLYTEGATEVLNIFQDEMSTRGTARWPTIRELEQRLVAPFERVSLRAGEGEYSWRLRTRESKFHVQGTYIGRSAKPKEYGSFLLKIQFTKSMEGILSVSPEQESPYSIWFKRGEFTLPSEVTEGALIDAGWRELINMTGQSRRDN
ncbi:DUF6162 family protein [Chitinivibrio alkaliphilus]|uniref:Uncharacterized protein n=1 Tax=Chitinivibrio alkaliphilus ACht1 TaxID=1313304 RepID=U7DC92_9BACT|nr:hypothetical protein [Chitinivibrio alkaliphilus]ERP32040.1 hypothetical protein CALK_1021 [Chitinivibrio alkaliphilus ACht1]